MKRLSALLLLFLPTMVVADVITLNDGTRYTGDLRRTNDGYVLTQRDGKVVNLSIESVRSIELGSGATNSGATSQSHLLSLRRAVEGMSDIPAVLERYKRFIETNANSPAAKEAEGDVAIWKDRQARGLVKVGTKWMTIEERRELQERSVLLAEQVRSLLKDGKLREAEPLLQQALEGDPKNVSALYLRGVIAYRQEQVTPARKAFEAVIAVMPDHAPTLNNLGVILFRQNQFAGAMGFYDQALVASPGNKLFIDNVGEALHAIPNDQKNRAQTQKALRHFTEQDAQLQAVMAESGWFRWGGTWVNREQLDRFDAAKKEVQDKLDAMAQQFDQATTRIETIDRQISDTQRGIRQIEANSYGRDLNGNPVQFSYPPMYYEMLKDLERMNLERQNEFQKRESLRQQAQSMKDRVPSPKYSGVQQIVGVEGTPLAIPVSVTTVTTQPTTNPSH